LGSSWTINIDPSLKRITWHKLVSDSDFDFVLILRISSIYSSVDYVPALGNSLIGVGRSKGSKDHIILVGWYPVIFYDVVYTGTGHLQCRSELPHLGSRRDGDCCIS